MNQWPRAIIISLLVGLVAYTALIVGLVVDPAHSFRSYLYAYLYFLGITAGALALSMVQHLVGGNWGQVIRRILESASLTLPLVALLVIPLLFGLHHLFPWAQSAVVAADPIVHAKIAYLNPTFFIVRVGAFFATWMIFAFILRRWALRYDQGPVQSLSTAIQKLSAAGVIIYVLTMTFAAVDWIMSRDPHYYSSIFGFIIVAGQALAALSFAILVLCLLSRRHPFDKLLTPQILVDLGSLLETLVILYAYLSFAQFLINWAGNSQREIGWYIRRTSQGWGAMILLVILLQFFIPFFALLSRHIKQSPSRLGAVAALVLGMRLIDLFWMVAPPATEPQPPLVMYWTDFIAPIGIGGIWLALFLWILGRHPLVPQHQLGEPEIYPNGQRAPGSIL